MRTAELIGADLDYWVARAEGLATAVRHASTVHARCWILHPDGSSGYQYAPSTSWAHGGPLIEKYKITPYVSPLGGWDGYNRPELHMHESHSPSALISVCRAVVYFKFGNEVQA